MRRWRAASAPEGAANSAEASVAPPARCRLFPVITAPEGAAGQAVASVAPPARCRLFPAITTLAVLALAACAGHTGPAAALPYDPLRETALVRDATAGFIAAEARGDESADTLLTPDADFIMTGIPVTRRPRLAGVLGRGEAAVEDSRTQLAGEFAWVVVVYRWTQDGGDDVERGRATMILERRTAGWRIRHVHSSTVSPWQ